MSKSSLSISIERSIMLLRDQRVMLDFQLADLYEVETRALKQAVRRNLDRFPSDFMFELTSSEIDELVSQNVIPGLGKFDAIRQLMTPTVKPTREMGFHTIPTPKPSRKGKGAT